MKGLPFHNRSRSIGAQIARMRCCWPDFQITRQSDTAVKWVGPLRGFQRFYTVGVIWGVEGQDSPSVFLIDPPLAPRDEATFEQIPHLMYEETDPALSAMCLFDPNGAEWSDHMLIADTTLPWAGEWLLYYELWHYDGIWRGGGVGPESIAQARAEALHRETKEHVSDAQEETAVAGRETLQDTVS